MTFTPEQEIAHAARVLNRLQYFQERRKKSRSGGDFAHRQYTASRGEERVRAELYLLKSAQASTSTRLKARREQERWLQLLEIPYVREWNERRRAARKEEAAALTGMDFAALRSKTGKRRLTLEDLKHAVEVSVG